MTQHSPGAQEILDLPSPKAESRIAYGADALQFGDLRVPNSHGPHPVAIVIHGGFWKAAYHLDHIGHLCAALTAAGVATWSLEYRRVGDPGGGWPGTCADIVQGAGHLAKIANHYRLDLNRIAALGHSAGGQLALYLAAERAIALRGVVSLAGVADLRRAWELNLGAGAVAAFLGGSPKQVGDHYSKASPIERVPLGVRQILIHGRDDDVVPIEISERHVNAARALGDDAGLIALPDTGHYEVIDPRSKQWAHVEQAVLSLVAGSE